MSAALDGLVLRWYGVRIVAGGSRRLDRFGSTRRRKSLWILDVNA
ncbi:hypothetical protein HD598_002128 [Neomicrococcus aestuarii]|uniref:Uncharacterized protein n=1 Tax=Neomicrococcus aestuarii TaxID=556325 RepID=A0A7W8WZJ1_9MICC|nr:hypothetical protein [Neomicrococcus aestuarii]MBB5513441.1 hypothetical protein [Neomicrococcus aestuarii]